MERAVDNVIIPFIKGFLVVVNIEEKVGEGFLAITSPRATIINQNNSKLLILTFQVLKC